MAGAMPILVPDPDPLIFQGETLMDTGIAIVAAVCIYVAWDMMRVGIHFWWQVTISERRHQEEIASASAPYDVKMRAAGTVIHKTQG